jgi:hypothetical protein
MGSKIANRPKPHAKKSSSRTAELLKGLSPAKRAAYNRIRRLRDSLGPTDLDTTKLIRDLRDHA